MTLLSICIPTYNRSECLGKTLENITSKEMFFSSDDIEIVISDNASIDNTFEVAQQYVQKFPTKISYFRNEVNIEDKNFEKVLSCAKGELLKLHNDTLSISDTFLTDLLSTIVQNQEEKPVIFLTNRGDQKHLSKVVVQNFNEFVSQVSFMSTWIGGFCIWREDFDRLGDFSKYASSNLAQTAILFEMVSHKKQAIILNDEYFELPLAIARGGYNVAQVFGQNYLELYSQYLASGELDKKVYQHEKQRNLFSHIIPDYFDLKGKYKFHKTGYLKYMNEYKKDWFFYVGFLKLAGDYIGVKAKNIVRSVK